MLVYPPATNAKVSDEYRNMPHFPTSLRLVCGPLAQPASRECATAECRLEASI